MSGIDKAFYDRKIKKARTSVTEEKELNAIWRTCCSNKENEELFQTVVKDLGDIVNTMSRSGLQEDMMLNKDRKVEQTTLVKGKNNNNSEHVGEHVNVQSNEANGQVKSRQWSNLFSKLERGKATFSTYAPRKRIYTKNENALIFEVHSLENIFTTDIVEVMVTKVREDLIAVKPIFTKNKRLEVVYANEDKQQFYAAEGITILSKPYRGTSQ
ncbi:hypothetical protein C2G38_2037450 [Gigaspora rosea]|uniref:Uncharacterized protein n=1 Tax=Gigaspora rosea TaxID=44941 RepID=A0A397VA19_9GLOM|nr:hypothetical protein C2G38_2037450 [Gigaspora rosea]